MQHILALALTSVMAVSCVQAADPSPAQKAQQMRMAQCNQDADGKTGDERKAFMKECLSAKRQTQQNKMTSCNASAGDKKGDERKAYMKECLSAKPAA